MIARIIESLCRCRLYALSIFLTYVVSSAIGIFMAHGGSTVALSQRDRIVKTALASDISRAHRSGGHVTAALFDAGSNLFIAAIPQAVMGLAVIPPYFSVAYQGWIGGIVSVDGRHRSRFRSARATSYYFIVLLLQFVPLAMHRVRSPLRRRALSAKRRCGLALLAVPPAAPGPCRCRLRARGRRPPLSPRFGVRVPVVVEHLNT